jgi:hypothetical protein
MTSRKGTEPLGILLAEPGQSAAGVVFLLQGDVMPEALADGVADGVAIGDLAGANGGGDEVQGLSFTGLNPSGGDRLAVEDFEPVEAPQVRRDDLAQGRFFLFLKNTRRLGGSSFLVFDFVRSFPVFFRGCKNGALFGW